MDTEIVGISVAVLVSLVVLAGVLIPILDDATTTEETFKNTGYYNMTDAESATIVWNYQSPRTLVVNGDNVSLPEPSGTERVIICGDSFLVGYSSNANGERLRYYDDSHALTANVSGESTLTMTCESGSYTITVGSTSYTGSYTELFHIATEGEYVMKDSATDAYVKGDDDILAMDWTSVGSAVVGIRADGTLDDGLTFSVFRGEGYTITNESVVSTSDADYKDLYKVGKLSLTISDGSNTKNKEITAYIVPAEVTAERVVHLSDNEIALMDTIPILVIVAILLGVIALVIGRRMN